MQTLPSLLQSKRQLCNMHLSKGLCPEHDIKLLNYLTINTDKIHTIMEDKEMIINNILAHKKNFGIFKDLKGKEILFYTTGGNFASDAWIASGGQNTGDVLGRTFMAFTADDGGFWNLSKHVYPISEERLLQLMETAHKNLWAVFEIDVLMEDPTIPLVKKYEWKRDRQLIDKLLEIADLNSWIKYYCLK